MKKIIIVLLACFILLAFTACNGLTHSPKSVYVYEKHTEELDGKTVFVVRLGQCKNAWYEVVCPGGNEHPEKQERFPKLRVELSSETYDLLAQGKYYRIKDLQASGVKINMKKNKVLMGDNQMVFRMVDVRREITDQGSAYIMILVKPHISGDDLNLTNPRIRVDISEDAYKSLVNVKTRDDRYFSVLELKDMGINLPAEKEDPSSEERK